jgi:5-methylcytosine-specific restriction endonuclease McrA
MLEKRKERIGIKQSFETKLKKSESIKKAWKNKKSKYHTKEYKELRSNITSKQVKGKKHPNYNKPSYNRFTIKKLKKIYPFFCKIEELKEHPITKKIQVRCKNHNCINSKNNYGWFTPNYEQLRGRMNAIEREEGNDGSYLYCSEECKITCPNYHIHGDPLSQRELPYILTEYFIFKDEVKRRNIEEYEILTCEICGNLNSDELIVHHEKPQAKYPSLSLDPSNAWILCGNNSENKCHIKKSHDKNSDCNIGRICRK